jgi:hypothetical protein
MDKEHSKSVNVSELIKSLDKQKVIDNTSTVKVSAVDFMVGGIPSEPDNSKEIVNKPQKPSSSSTENFAEFQNSQDQPQQTEAKGKTVFEEVGDWFITKIKGLKNKIIKILISLVLATFIFFGLDIFYILRLSEKVYTLV